MEKAIATFKNDDRIITINFELDDNGNLDYQTTVEPPFNSENEINNGGLNVYLANIFLNALLPNSEFVENNE